ncbi:GGDEF domain-containing protein [Thermodesulfobacteriota bacterium]
MQTAFYENLLENLYDGIYYVNRNRIITFWNTGAKRITGYRKDEVVGTSCADNILRHIDGAGTELCLEGCPLARTLIDGEIRDAEVYLHHKEGYRVPVSVRVAPIADEAGDIVGAVEVFSDNSKRAEMLREMEDLQRAVFVDPLTGVGNRKFAEMNLAGRLKELEEYDVAFGLLFLDVDHFKQFNDTYGHATGDRMLQLVAKTVENLMRGMDAVCRWGGEEFVVVLPNLSLPVLSQVAERIRVFIEKSWLEVDGQNLRVTLSVGGTLAVGGDTMDRVVSRADSYMYKSKKAGRNRVTIQ